VKHGIPWVYGGVIGTYGMTMTIRPHTSPCLRCLFPEAPGAGAAPTCDTAGVLGPAVDVVAGLQVAEAMKLAVGATDSLNPGLLSVDVWTMAVDRIELSTPMPGCPTCDAGSYEYLDGSGFNLSTSLCGHDAIQILAHTPTSLDLEELETRLAPSGETLRNRFLLRFRPLTSAHELTIFPDGRAIIKGTTDPIEARSLYARYIGN
jgi:adenylyltransferase/sulfurtransferase